MSENPTAGPDAKVLAEAVRRVVEVAQPRRIILFGSAVRGNMGPDSDLDLLVEVEGPVNRFHKAQEIYRGLFGLGFPVDVVVATTEDLRIYKETPGTIYSVALEEGRVVYGG